MKTVREKVAHLCRRFGLGATIADLDRYEKMGLDATIRDLLDFSKPDPAYPVHASEFFYQKDGQVQTQPNRVTAWWLTRMALTDRPSRDKLLIFLHDHFAISASKIESGPVMLDHVRMLEKNMTQPFATLLEEVSTDPGMLIWLDLRLSIKGAPNENFARELLELFTLGIGNYTEKDIQEAAKALTGWGLRNITAERGRDAQREAFNDWVMKGTPLVAACFSPALSDEGPHELLGQRKRFDLSSTCDFLAKHPTTATYLCTKLWEYYAYPQPEKKVVERLAKAWVKSEGRIPAVMLEMTKMDEFWSEKAERTIIKSPIDYVIPVVRQVIDPKAVLADRPTDATATTPASPTMLNLANTLVYLCNKLGMAPLYPPDVAGWNWGTAWLSTSTVLDRINMANIFGGRAKSVAQRLQLTAQARGVSGDEGLIRLLAETLDVPLSPEDAAVLIEIAQKNGLARGIANTDATARAMLPILRTVFAMPAFQMC
ncbi:MAG: DUF1800 domain-containing protein [Fimbriimonadaceae bacterium]|nr:DUF1800 domain-containing protein [Fimbriimonadaceae bacterium]